MRPRNGRLLSYWHAHGSILYALYRDFDSAAKALRHAESKESESSWMEYCRAHIELRRDAWESAWETAKRAWQNGASHPFLALLLHEAALLAGAGARV